jgi:hypothetical protein
MTSEKGKIATAGSASLAMTLAVPSGWFRVSSYWGQVSTLNITSKG